jgi:hypothetical protein
VGVYQSDNRRDDLEYIDEDELFFHSIFFLISVAAAAK